jgi:phosphatidylinositol glycan class V
VHLLGVAKSGYLLEHNHAFYPLVPLATRALARLPLGCDARTRLVLAGAALSHASFLGAVSVFESLSRTVLTSPGAARTATLLFVLQPAAVFTLAPYPPSPY